MLKINRGRVGSIRKGLINFSGNVIKIVFGSILFILAISSIVYTCDLRNTETALEVTFYNYDNIFKYMILIIIIIGISVFLSRKRYKRKKIKVANYFEDDKIIKFLILIHGIMGIVWIVSTQLQPRADQWFCSAIGGNLLTENYNKADLLKGGYLYQYPFQSGLVIVFESIYKLTGINNYLAFQMLNVCAIMIIDIFIIKILKKMFSRKVEKIGLLFLMLFCPIVFYSSYLYGNLIGCGFSIMAMYFEYCFFENHSKINLVFGSISIGLAIIFKSNYLIALLAMLIFLILDWIIHLNKKNIVFFIFAVGCYIIATSGMISLINRQEDVKLGSGVPKVTWIAMGMQESDMAPGWYNAYNASTYLNNDCNSEATSKEAEKYIVDRIKYFKQNPVYTVKFYVKKMISQWCEPTFGGIWINQFEKGITVSRYMDSILSGGKLQKIIVWVLDIVQSAVYWLAFLYVIINRKNRNIYVWFPATVFIGGFLFHMIWEAKGQYTFTYFILLIPYAAISIKTIMKRMEKISI